MSIFADTAGWCRLPTLPVSRQLVSVSLKYFLIFCRPTLFRES